MLSEQEARLIGASDMPALAGLSPWAGPFAVWARVTHGHQAQQTEAMGAGHAAEEYVRALYRQATGYELLGPSKWRHPLHPWLRCSPDDRAVPEPERRRLVELKRYQFLEGWGPAGSDVVPTDIWLQVQVQAGVGLDLGEVEDEQVEVAALLRGELRLYSVPHMPEVYERALALCERFWRDHVRTGVPPLGDGLLERDAEAMRALYPAPKVEVPLQWEALSPGQQQVVRRWAEANRARKAWERQEEALKVQVEALLREAPRLVGLPEEVGSRVDYSAHAPRARLDEKALRKAAQELPEAECKVVLGLLEKHTKHESTRPLVLRGGSGA